MDIDLLRQDFPALDQYVWFQNGGVSITPQPVADEHARLMQELLQRGPMHIVYPDEEYPRRQRSLQRLADFLDVSSDELALMRGVSEAFQTVLRGLTWCEGDRIVITEDEEASVLLPVLHLRDRLGVKVDKIPFIADVAGQIEALDAAVSDRTRLIAVSHVSTDIGHRLPIREICGRGRELGVPTFVDMAHSAGLYPISVSELGCDFAGILSYKWMYAPYASGLLYVRSDQTQKLALSYAGGRSEAWLDFERDDYGLRETAERFQYGPWSWPLIHSWAFGAGYLEEIGLGAIWDRTILLANRFKEGLKSVPGSMLFTPDAPEFSAALVAFGIGGMDGESLCRNLRARWNIITKPLPHTREGLRISLAFFTMESEVDLLLEKLHLLVSAR